MSRLQEAIHSINKTLDQILETSELLQETIIRWKPANDVWSIMEILCHIEEATPYWLGELQQVVNSPGIEWGRGLQHEGRLAAVAQAPYRSVDDVLNGIRESKQKVQEVLSSIQDHDLMTESPSRNPRFGTKPMWFIVEHLLAEHLDTHWKQIQRNIQQYKDMKQAN
jgi:uncharacterized damage-inducible protein DinB